MIIPVLLIFFWYHYILFLLNLNEWTWNAERWSMFVGTAVGKLLTLGGVGIWWIVDIILLVLGELRPADDSNWVPYYWHLTLRSFWFLSHEYWVLTRTPCSTGTAFVMWWEFIRFTSLNVEAAVDPQSKPSTWAVNLLLVLKADILSSGTVVLVIWRLQTLLLQIRPLFFVW